MKPYQKKLCALSVAAMLLTGCGADDSLTPPVDPNELVAPYTEETLSPADAAEPAEPLAEDRFRAVQYQFALELFRDVYAEKEGENTMVSPYSVMQALAMSANGAAGETLAEMEQLLAGGASVDALNRSLLSWRSSQPDTEKCKLKTANGIWMYDGDFEANVQFLQINATYYGAELRKASFDSETTEEINKWVKKNTDNMIPKIVGSLDPRDRMVIVNAVCFDAKWRDKYKPEDVKDDRTFTNADGSTANVQMLYSDESEYFEKDGAQGFFRYYDGPYAFVGILPPEDVIVSEWLGGLTVDDLQSMIESRTETAVRAGIPAFQYDTDAALSGILADMGMPLAFSDAADFSGISETPLYISSVLHKTHIELDANGTKAAAATAVTFGVNSASFADEKKYVILNRPFVYLIYDTENELPVFIGTVQAL